MAKGTAGNGARVDELERRLGIVEKDALLAHGDYAANLAQRFRVIEDRLTALEANRVPQAV